ncbi:terpene synthase family protein [Streptomyces sp. NPDC059688]|uniref:terpene synthase family protein n=1 Tax=Streptomyces sp. NPDC059688 TaxID=3346906 RepID=UPI00368E9864
MPALIAWAFPQASSRDFRLMTDILSWFTILDDLFDGPAGRSKDAACLVIAPLIECMKTGGGSRVICHPEFKKITDAWANLWQRQVTGTVSSWRVSAAKDWRLCLETFIKEAENRQNKHDVSLEESILLRRYASCTYPYLNFLERTLAYQVPATVSSSAEMARLHAHVADTITYINDIYSVFREQEMGDDNNVLIILQRERGESQEEALRTVIDHLGGLAREMRILEDDLRNQGVEGVYFTGLKQMIQGVQTWTAQTSRYSAL